MLNKKIVILTLVSALFTLSGWAQVGQSPYSFLGLGNINSQSSDRVLNITGVGLDSLVSAEHPALLARSAYFTTFSGGLGLESRGFSTENAQARTTSGGFEYLSLTFPILFNKVGFSIGARPYSTVNYDQQREQTVVGSNESAQYQLTGDGGLAEVYAASGYRVTNNLMLGFKARYLFGSIEENAYSYAEQSEIPANTYYARRYQRTNFSDIKWSGSIALRQPLSSKTFLTGAFTYDAEADLSTENYIIAGRTNDFGNPIISDTTFLAENEESSFKLPATYRLGLAYEHSNRYAIEARLNLQNWSDLNTRTGEGEATSATGQQGYNFNLGGAWVPDYTSSKYYNVITYVAGIQLNKEPFAINGEDLNEFGINFGSILPVGLANRNRGEIGTIRLLFTVGQRGKTENNLISERYFRANLGVSLNARWFNKRKID